jgi:TatD DNase family protein
MASHRFVDIGANLLDERFVLGEYRGKPRHEPDFDQVVERAAEVGMRHMILTAGTLDDSRDALAKIRQLRETTGSKAAAPSCQLYCTVGVHPTRCGEFEGADDGEARVQALIDLAKDGMADGVVVSVGEMGLDYDRLDFCAKDVQLKWIRRQLRLAKETGLPLFLHNRNVSTDLYDVLLEHRDQWTSGVVHSFDDTLDLANKFMDLGLYIGLNGCSLRTQESLNVVRHLPLDRILIETDCPYCDVKRTHAGYQYVKTVFDTVDEKKFKNGVQVKGRNEPCNIIQVAEVIAGCKGIDVTEVTEACYQNSLRLYGWKE